MASNDAKNSETGHGKLTMLEARLLVAKNGVENLTSEQKDLIVGAVARDVNTALAEARYRWVKRESLTAEQSAILMDWMWRQVDHNRLLNKGELWAKKVSKNVKEENSVPQVAEIKLGSASKTSLRIFGSPAPSPCFGAPSSSGANPSSGAPPSSGAFGTSGLFGSRV